MKKLYKVLTAIVLCICLIIGGGVGFLSASTHKSETVLFQKGQSSIVTDSGVNVTRLKNGNIEFSTDNSDKGIILYPGGSVDYTAYAPLLERLAQNNFLCILVKMPLSLAVFDQNAADGIIDTHPEISEWYIGGHSLGGAMAGTYFADNSDDFDGLILLAAYSTSDISNLDKRVISIYGSNDGVLNMQRYEQYRVNLPEDVEELVIDGGCHSYFGDYGMQKGDGIPTISRDKQLDETVEYIVSEIEKQ